MDTEASEGGGSRNESGYSPGRRRVLRIFISSPSDVKQERQRAREVIESLRRRYASRFILKPVFWEDLPLVPDMSFQEGIDLVLSEQGVDVSVFILWSRLGSPLGALIRKPDGTEYRSGTEREYDLMLRTRAQTREREGQPRPALLVYTRQDDASFAETLRAARSPQEHKELLEQKQLVDSFLSETFQDQDTGANIGAYCPFDRPVTFSQRLRTHLQTLFDGMVGDMDEVVWDCEKQGAPFLGLEAFQPQHAEIFFGRETEILEARNALKHQAANGFAFLLISGASGSGKSSLARAGLLPEIVSHEIDDQISGWCPLVITPSELGENPLRGLLRMMAEGDTALPELHDHCQSLDQLALDLAANPEAAFRDSIALAMDDAAKRIGGGLRILLVLDQLEELYTMATTAEERTAFLAAIQEMARSRIIWVVATVRADFYPQIQSEPFLARLKEGRGLFDLLPPTPDAILRLIEEPARIAGLRFEERDGKSLVARLSRDAASHVELLPLLEFVLLELYSRRDDQNRMTYAAYEEVGGVEGALARRAEETFSKLPGEAQQALDPVLRAMVTLSEGTADGEPERTVRQRISPDACGGKPGALLLIDAFTKARLFTAGHAMDSPSIALAHEALLRVWPRAVEWRAQNQDFLRARARIANRIKEGSPLLKGDPLLETARAFLTTHREGFTGEQRDWITATLARADEGEKKARMRRRAAFASLAALAIAATGAALVAFNSRAHALREQAEAESQRRMSQNARSTAESIVADIMGDLGTKLKEMKQFTILEPASAASLRYFDQLPPSERDAEYGKITAQLAFQRADILYRLGRFKEAEPLFLRARDYYADPRSPDHSKNKAASASSFLAKCRAVSGNVDGARETLADVRERLREAREDTTNRKAGDMNELMGSVLSVIWVEIIGNRPATALEVADEGYALFKELDAAGFFQAQWATNLNCRFTELRSMAYMLSGRHEEVVDFLQPAIDRAEALFKRSKVGEWDRWMNSYYGRLLGIRGDCHLFAGESAEAMARYTQALELLQKASLERNLAGPADEIQSDVWLGMVHLRMGIASIGRNKRDFLNAKVHFENAELVFDRVLKGDDVDGELAKSLMQVVKNAAPILLENTPSISQENKMILMQIMMEFDSRY